MYACSENEDRFLHVLCQTVEILAKHIEKIFAEEVVEVIHQTGKSAHKFRKSMNV